MQSAVLGNAFMMGTPVLASRIGSFEEYVQDGYNGFFVDDVGDFDKITELYHTCRDNSDRFAANCRQTFLSTFWYRSKLEVFKRVLEEVFVC
jgi:glycosyltransferase involved in cell wall biosynthesis